MAFSRTAQLATFLALASSVCAFAPSHISAYRRNTATKVSASNQDDDGWKKMAGSAVSFVAGIGFLAQVAFADSNSIAPLDEARTVSHASSSNVLLSAGAPTFGGGGKIISLSLPGNSVLFATSSLFSPSN